MAKTKTQTETKAAPEPKVVIEVSPKLVSAVKARAEAQVKADSLFLRIADLIVEETSRLKYDEKQRAEMVRLSYREAYDIEEKDGATFDLKMRPDVSKVLRLAFPTNARAEQNVIAARDHNEKADPSDKIGVNKLLEIARDNTTFKQVIDNKKAKKDSKKVSYNANMFADDLATAVSKAKKADMTLAQCQKAWDKLMADWQEKETKKE